MSDPAPAALQERLQRYLRDTLAQSVQVRDLCRLAGGVSRETWRFELLHPEATGEPPQTLVLRKDTAQPFIDMPRSTEASLIRLAGEHGVPVPRVYWHEDDPAVLGGAFFIMEYLAGESVVPRLHKKPRYAAAREVLTEQLARALAAVHRITPGEHLPPAVRLSRFTPVEAVQEQERLYRERAVEPHPTLELALRWLRENTPAAGAECLVHGDFRPGNVLFDEQGLRAVLDWELAFFGDPMADVTWVALRSWRGGRDALPVGGFATREAFHAAYEAAGGTVRRDSLPFWDVFSHVRWAVITLMELRGYLDGVANIELASLGRRTAEIEWDLLSLLEQAG